MKRKAVLWLFALQTHTQALSELPVSLQWTDSSTRALGQSDLGVGLLFEAKSRAVGLPTVCSCSPLVAAGPDCPG